MPDGGAGVLRFLINDQVSSTSLAVNLTSFGSAEMGEMRYHPFGTERFSSGTVSTRRQYTGQIHDLETGLYFYNARYYDPAIGHFIQADKKIPNPKDARDFDRYAYVRNNPIRYNDPTGHCAVGATTGGIIGGAAGVGVATPATAPIGAALGCALELTLVTLTTVYVGYNIVDGVENGIDQISSVYGSADVVSTGSTAENDVGYTDTLGGATISTPAIVPQSSLTTGVLEARDGVRNSPQGLGTKIRNSRKPLPVSKPLPKPAVPKPARPGSQPVPPLTVGEDPTAGEPTGPMNPRGTPEERAMYAIFATIAAAEAASKITSFLELLGWVP